MCTEPIAISLRTPDTRRPLLAPRSDAVLDMATTQIIEFENGISSISLSPDRARS
jgi:hypothetical protein